MTIDISALAQPTDLGERQSAVALVIATKVPDKISNKDEAVLVGDAIAEGKAKRKEIDDYRKTWVEPLNKQVNRFNEMFGKILGPLDEVLDKWKKIFGDWTVEQNRLEELETKRLNDLAEADRKAKVEAATAVHAQAAIDAIANDEPPPPPPPSVAPADEYVPEIKKSYGGTRIRMIWTCKVIDIKLVPADCLEIDRTKVMARRKNGGCPGIEYFQKPAV